MGCFYQWPLNVPIKVCITSAVVRLLPTQTYARAQSASELVTRMRSYCPCVLHLRNGHISKKHFTLWHNKLRHDLGWAFNSVSSVAVLWVCLFKMLMLLLYMFIFSWKDTLTQPMLLKQDPDLSKNLSCQKS